MGDPAGSRGNIFHCLARGDEDRWHLVFARRDQVSTRTTLEFSYQHVAAHTHDALRAIGSTILDTANGEPVMLRNPQLPCASVAVVTRDTLTENSGRVQKEVPQQLSFLVNDVVTWLVQHGHLRKVERPPIELDIGRDAAVSQSA
ncbi:hypothetical protein RI054_15g73970 [Pseudoscourfieldia marina]